MGELVSARAREKLLTVTTLSCLNMNDFSHDLIILFICLYVSFCNCFFRGGDEDTGDI